MRGLPFEPVAYVPFATYHGILPTIVIGPEDRILEIIAWRRDEVSVQYCCVHSSSAVTSRRTQWTLLANLFHPR